MALFGFGKKKEETVNAVLNACGCDGNCAAESIKQTTSVAKPPEGQLSVKILGSGCARCHALLENTQEALRNLGIDIVPEYVTDMETVMSYGVMSMPALVVNEQVVSMGQVLKAKDVEKLI